MASNTTEPSSNRNTVYRYVRSHILPRKWNLLLILLKNICGALLYMLPPYLSKYILDYVLPKQDWNWLVVFSLCMVIAPITGSMLIVLENKWGRFLLQLAGHGRAHLYNGIQHQPLTWLRKHRTGDFLTRILDDTLYITNMVNGHIGFMMFHVVTIITGSVILLSLQPLLAIGVLAMWAGQAFLMSTLRREIKEKAANIARQNSIFSEQVRELVSASSFIKAMGQEDKALKNMRTYMQQEWEHTRKGVLSDHRVQLFQAFLNAAALVQMYVAGGWFVSKGSMTLGSLMAFIAVYQWLRPFGAGLIGMSLTVIKLGPTVGRVSDIAYSPQSGEVGVIPSAPFTVEASDVAYQHEHRSILRGIQFQIAPGSIVSIVGHRGAGKSTLAELLLGLQEPSAGRIQFSGVPLPLVDRMWLRQSVLCVTQEVLLRSGSIQDNLLYGLEDVSMEELREAIHIADLTEWIARLPSGLDTQVGEQALQLSGGERQRISIARALLRKPEILILDEATSALDMGTERRLLSRLIESRRGTTLIFITHRLEITLRSDNIYLLHDGRISDCGTHEQLLLRSGIYQELWREQAS